MALPLGMPKNGVGKNNNSFSQGGETPCTPRGPGFFSFGGE